MDIGTDSLAHMEIVKPEEYLPARFCKTIALVKECVLEALFLSDFYYGARYPGEDYIEVTLEEAQRAADIVDEVVQAVDRLKIQLKKEK